MIRAQPTGAHGRAALLVVGLWVGLGPAAQARAQTRIHERDAAGRAVVHSPSLRAAIIDVQIARLELMAVEADRGASFFAGTSGSYDERLNATAEGVSANTSQRLSANTGVRDVTDWGMSLEAALSSSLARSQVNRDPSTTRSVQIDPTFGAELSLSARQPLLRGAGTGPREAELAEARARRTASEHARDDAASELLRQALAAYWELWYAERTATMQQEALALATEQHRTADIRANDLGTLAQSEVLRFESELANIEEALAQAEAQRRSRSMELGRLLGQRPPAGSDFATEDDEPQPVRVPSLSQALARARQASSALRAAESNIAASRHSARLADDNALTRLDLTGSLTGAGVWADQYFDFGVLPSDRPALSGMVGLELELPFGNSVAEVRASGAHARVAAAEARAEAQVSALETETATLVNELAAAARRVELAGRSSSIAEALAEAERHRFELGTTTTLGVVEAQQSHRQAELRHLRALVDQRTLTLRLEHVTGALLERYAEVLIPVEGSRSR